MNLAQTGKFLTQRRAAMGLTQAQLAQRLDVTDKAVSKWERGKSLPDITLLNRLAAELRVSVVEILSEESLQVGRSSNIDQEPPWEGVVEQAESLTLPQAETEDLLVSPLGVHGDRRDGTASGRELFHAAPQRAVPGLWGGRPVREKKRDRQVREHGA